MPDLWLDWCSVAGVPAERVDEQTLEIFARKAGPSRAVLAKLRRLVAPEHPVAPAWPHAHREDAGSLRRLVGRTSVLLEDPSTHWVLRLRLRRMLFAAVLIAPPSHGGLGLDRARARGLRPDGMLLLRPRIGVAVDPRSCPACAVWSWLDVIGTNNGWSPVAVRAVGHRRDGWSLRVGEHRHLLTDPSPDWHDCVGMLPAVDRWGWIDAHSSMHPSSLSAVISAMGVVLEGPAPVPSPLSEPLKASIREVTQEEAEQIFARADNVNARVARILAERG